MFLLGLAAFLTGCGSGDETSPSGVTTSVSEPGSSVPATTVLSTTTTTEPAYHPVPIEEIDTVAATEVFFPRTEAQHAAWGDRHN